MDAKLKKLLDSLDRLDPKDDMQESMISLIRGTIIALQKRIDGADEDSLAVIAEVSRTADKIGLGIIGELVGDQYGPIAMRPDTDEVYYN